ncbi:MAG: T9SS type A sorting domain-containing protein [Flavobacteriales bacterium]
MKKTLLFGLFLGTALSSMAQRALHHGGNDLTLKSHYTGAHGSTGPIVYSGNRDVIWTDDFSVPSTWVIGNISDPNNDNWVIGTAVPSGAFAIPGIESTTAANGFALFDSDLLCGGTQNAYVQMATPVDLSTYPGAVLQFEQYYRNYIGFTYVDVSNDGTNWTEFQVNADIAGNDDTPNPDLYSLNISGVAGGQATVWVRFRYVGGCDYAWMVDDVAIVELPANEIIMDYGFTSHTGNGEEYGRIPSDQLNPTMNVGAEVSNFGSDDQTNVVVSMSVVNESLVEVFNATQDLGTLASGDTLSMDQDVTLPALPAGLYTATFTMTSDQIGLDGNPADNSRVRTFRITDDLYTLDGIGDHPAGLEDLTQTGSGSFTDNTENVKLLTYYELATAMDPTGVQVELGSATEAGSFLYVSVHDTAAVFANDLVTEIGQSDFYTITAADITAGSVTIPFLDPFTLQPGGYYVSANLFQDTGHDIYVLDDETVPQPNAASMLWIPNDAQNLYGGNGVSWAVRLTSNTSIGMNEASEVPGLTMYPNPTHDIVRISTTKNEKYTVEVMNILGEVVLTTNFTGNTVLDLAAFADGVYSVRVSNSTSTSVQRVTLN